MVGFAVVAAAVSLLQFALEIAIFAHVGGHASASGTRTLFKAVNKADTVKLILLAGFVATATAAARQRRALPGWVPWEGIATVPFLAIGGLALVIDYATLNLVLSTSLLLLLWAAAASVTILRRTAPHRVAAP